MRFVPSEDVVPPLFPSCCEVNIGSTRLSKHADIVLRVRGSDKGHQRATYWLNNFSKSIEHFYLFGGDVMFWFLWNTTAPYQTSAAACDSLLIVAYHIVAICRSVPPVTAEARQLLSGCCWRSLT